MNLSYLHFFCIISYFYLSIFILRRDPSNRLNVIGCLYFICLSIWSLESFVFSLPGITKGTALFWTKIGCIGWMGSLPTAALLTIYFTENEALLQKIHVKALLIGPFLLAFAAQCNLLIIDDLVPTPYGWYYSWSKSVWPSMYTGYFISGIVYIIFLFHKFKNTTRNKKNKQMSRLLIYIVIIIIGCSILVSFLLPNMGIYIVPPIGDFIFMMLAAAFVYFMLKHSLMSISPFNAADQIITTMTGLLFLLDPKGQISTVNKAVLDRLGYKIEDLEGLDFFKLLDWENNPDSLAEKEKILGKVDNQRVKIKSSGSETIPLIVSSSQLINYRKSLLGTVVVANDITPLVKVEKELEALITDLETALKEVSTLSGLLPICAHCKKIRDDKGYWNRIESFISERSEAIFSHSMCPECSDELYGHEEWYKKMKKKRNTSQ